MDAVSNKNRKEIVICLQHWGWTNVVVVQHDVMLTYTLLWGINWKKLLDHSILNHNIKPHFKTGLSSKQWCKFFFFSSFKLWRISNTDSLIRSKWCSVWLFSLGFTHNCWGRDPCHQHRVRSYDCWVTHRCLRLHLITVLRSDTGLIAMSSG